MAFRKVEQWVIGSRIYRNINEKPFSEGQKGCQISKPRDNFLLEERCCGFTGSAWWPEVESLASYGRDRRWCGLAEWVGLRVGFEILRKLDINLYLLEI